MAYAMPNDDDTTLVAVMLPKTELAAFKQDIEGNFERFINKLPDGPNFRNAERTFDVIGRSTCPIYHGRRLGRMLPCGRCGVGL